MGKLPLPRITDRVQYALNRSTTSATIPGLQGSAVSGSTGGTLANGTTYREVVCVAGQAAARIRLLTVTSTGTLTVTPIRPEVAPASIPDEAVMRQDGAFDTSKVVKYTTGGVARAVAAGVEAVVDIALAGENYILVEFACTANGTLTYCDAGSIDFQNVVTAAGDGSATSAVNGVMLFNGTTFDRQRNTFGVQVLNAVARTTSFTSGDIPTYNARGLIVSILMSNAGTGSVTLTINGKDPFATVYPLLVGAAITTNSTNVYRVFPGATVTANVSANDILPTTCQLVVTANNANATSYLMSYVLTV